MNDLIDYLKDRDNAMLLYPDTKGIEKLVSDYPTCFSPQFLMMWEHATQYTKVRTLELMIKQWVKAPKWLSLKVEQAEKTGGRE